MEVIGFEAKKTIKEVKKGEEIITIRFDPEKISTLTCVKSGEKFNIIEDNIEFLNDDGYWEPYPYIKGFCRDDKFFTEALVITEKDEASIKIIES